MEEKIQQEIDALNDHLNAKIHTSECEEIVIDMAKPVSICIANIIDNILFGKTYAYVKL